MSTCRNISIWLYHMSQVATIRRWYSAIDGNPGFTQEAFDSLKVKDADANEKGEDIVCSLMLDEMSIMRHLDFDGKRVVGYVDVGTHLRVTIILHAILCILSLHHNRRPNPAICLFQSLIILCQIKLSR